MLETYCNVIVGALVATDGFECSNTQSSSLSQCVAHAAAHQPFDISDGPNIMQLPSSVNECG